MDSLLLGACSHNFIRIGQKGQITMTDEDKRVSTQAYQGTGL